MVAALALFILTRNPVVADLNALAQARDVEGLAAYASGSVTEKDFAFLRGTGAYGVGRYPWSALQLDAPSGKTYLVFSTRVTSQDIGEQLFVLEGEKITRKVEELETGGISLDHCDFDVSFMPGQKRVILTAVSSFEKQANPEADLIFRLSNTYHVRSITGEGGEAVPFRQAGGVVAVKPPAANEFKLTIKYEGTLGDAGFAGAATDTEFMLTEDYWWPVVGREPLTFNTVIRTPADWFAVTNGDLASEKVAGGEAVREYRMDVPICFLSLSAGKMAVKRTEPINGISYWVASSVLTDAEMEQQLRVMPAVVEFYSTYKPYPFKSFGAVDSELYVGGALEAYSYATYGHGWLPDEDAHEPAHTWFGGIIPNTYLKSFWNESFAEYMSGLYRREGAIGSKPDKRRAFVDQPRPNRSWSQTTMENSGAATGPVASTLGYGKGSYVLQQLEYEMGRERMAEAVKAWLARYPNGREAEWADFEAVCGPQWKWFFDQWVRRSGAPSFTFQNVRREGGRIVGEAVFQGQPYRLKVEAVIRDGEGDTYTSFDLVPVEGSQSVSFSIPCPASARMVAFDPLGRLPITHPGERDATISMASRRATAMIDPRREEWAPERVRRSTDKARSNKLIIGHPDSMPEIRDLLPKAGFSVEGNTLTYRGQKYSLDTHVALAVVDLPEGGQAVIRLGMAELNPNTGQAQVAVCDSLGRFLAGRTEPMTKGDFAFPLNQP